MEKSKLRSFTYNAVIILLLIAGIVYVVLQFTHFGYVEYTDNARVCQYIAPQNTRVQGFIREIRFEAYQHVNEGDTLVILEDSEYKLRLARYAKKLAKEHNDPTLMTKEEYFAMLDEAEQQLARGEGMAMLPGEDLTTFLKRNGYEI